MAERGTAPALPRRMYRLLVGLLSFAVLLVVTTCRDDQSFRVPTAVSRPPAADLAAGTGPVTLVGAGNIAVCGQPGAAATALLLDSIPGTVFGAGDNAYDKGTLTQYNTCYGVTWGRQKARTQPALGDLDYKTANASGYFGYFGAAAGDPKQGYYRYDSKDNPNANIRPLWDVLYAAGVDVVVNAHYGFYERFAPQTPAGVADPAGGIREFVVGTGGALVTGFGTVRANSQVRNSGTFGVLNLTLGDGSYSWQ